NMTFNVDRMRQAAASGCLAATDLAEYLVEKGVPFREAHGIVGRVVARCLERQCEPEALSLDELRAFSQAIGEDVYQRLTVEGSVNSRLATGNTGLPRVTEALEKAEQFLEIQA
ncbi:MAG TPA: argininosuccinate lyase, partial [Desulfobulbaceae bacterium]|nr:argininosuccinate lyase [Desulfobulbaceae bacterium]